MTEVGHLWATANGVVAELVQWLKEREGKTFYVRFKPVDILRLTRLRVWCFRYRIEMDELLSLTLPYLRKSISSKQKSRYGLGVSVATLTSRGAEKILIEALRQRYPEREHIAVWRERERTAQLAREQAEELGGLSSKAAPSSKLCTILTADSPQDFIKSYSERIMRQRTMLRQAYTDEYRKRLRYRNSPWL